MPSPNVAQFIEALGVAGVYKMRCLKLLRFRRVDSIIHDKLCDSASIHSVSFIDGCDTRGYGG